MRHQSLDVCHPGKRNCRKTREQGFETAPGKRDLLSPNGMGIDINGVFPFVLRSRRSAAASRRTVLEKADSLESRNSARYTKSSGDG